MATRVGNRGALLVTALLATGCGTPAGPPSQAPATSDTRASGPPPGAAATGSSHVLRFEREVDGLRQRLQLQNRTDGGFDVTLAATGACTRSETGAATAVASAADADVEVAPDGEGHPVDAFILTGGDACRVTIRLAAPDRRFAWVRESDCTSACPFTDKAMLRQ